MTITPRRTNLLLPLVLVAACSRTPSARQTGASTTLYRPAAIIAWLDCVECTKAQLDAVAALRDNAVPELGGVLLNGPPKERIDKQRQYLTSRYQELVEYQKQHQTPRQPSTEAEYVNTYVDRFIMLNRLRSARALGAIGTPAAKGALTQAAALPKQPEELQRAIREALSRIP